jgi:tRNA threonylcarbamoyladenosine biosynthesis protein TsaE
VDEGNVVVTRYSQDESTCVLDIVSHSTTQTQRLAKRLGELLRGGELILLEGNLGTGKTTFTQGLAQGLHINEVISSPTFTLLKEYPGQLLPPYENQPGQPRYGMRVGPALYHFDLYRIDDPEEVLDLGFDEYFYGSGVCVVEWADKAEDALWSVEKLRIRMKVLSETKRGLLFTATGARYCELLRQFQKNTYASASS